MIRPLVTGSEGLLGHVLAERLEETYPDTVSATRAFLDITEYWGMTAELEPLTELLALETGRSKKDARGEVNASIESGFFYAGEGRRFYGRTTTSAIPNRTAASMIGR